MFYGSISIPDFSGSIDACTNSGYQALLLHREGAEDEAKGIPYVNSTRMIVQNSAVVHVHLLHPV